MPGRPAEVAQAAAAQACQLIEARNEILDLLKRTDEFQVPHLLLYPP